MTEQESVPERLKQIWCDDWPQRHRERVLATGVSTIAEFLRKHPGEPYHKLGKYVENLIAAVQFQKLQFDEAIAQGQIRHAAMDLLVRMLADNLKYGWERGGHWKYNRVAAASDFRLDLVRFGRDPELRRRAEAVWRALEELKPPADWVPRSTDDVLIQHAFDIGWPDPSQNADDDEVRAGE